MLLKNPQCFNQEIKEEIRKYLKTKENKNYLKSMGYSKNKFIETHAYLKKQEKSQINNLKEKEQTEPNKEINRNLKI